VRETAGEIGVYSERVLSGLLEGHNRWHLKTYSTDVSFADIVLVLKASRQLRFDGSANTRALES
jgi:hypothetical protein